MEKINRVLFLIFLSISSNLYAQQDRLIKDDIYTSSKNEKSLSYYNEGTDNIDKGEFRASITPLKLAIAIDSNFIDAYDNLGLAYRKLGELDSALLYYKISQHLFPKGEAVIMNLGVLYKVKKDYPQSEFYFKKLINLNTQNPEGYYGLTNTYLNWEKFDKALENSFLAEKYYKIANSPTMYIADCYSLRTYIYLNLGKYSEAKKCLFKAKELGNKVDPDLEKELQKF
jgi:tetratricopeptide (TPR) repeat protein